MKDDTIILIGTRPDIIKMYPIITQLNGLVCHSGQHFELAIKQLSSLSITPDIVFRRKQQSLTGMLSELINNLDSMFSKANIKRIFVHGDTHTALAGALWGFNNHVDVIHIEAGLRSFDYNNPYPEEMNRQLIDRLSTYKFAPSYLALQNLHDEKIGCNSFMTGNTLIDCLDMLASRISDVSPINDKYIIWTTHRRENIPELINIFSTLKAAQEKYTIVFPIHLNPDIKKIADDIGINYIDNLDYITFLSYIKHCQLIVTDSGGLQEEAVYFNKPILILRQTTERPELLSTSYALLSNINKQEILEKIDYLFNKNAVYYPFYGKGGTVDKIKTILDL